MRKACVLPASPNNLPHNLLSVGRAPDCLTKPDAVLAADLWGRAVRTHPQFQKSIVLGGYQEERR
jgi:hypothetical protein